MEQREQEYQELLKRHKKDIAAIIKRYQEQNQRLEYENLQQEYDASPLDEVFPEADNERIAYQASYYPAPSRSHWQDDPPAKCSVQSCKAREFRPAYDGRGLPWWICTCGHRVFGYWRTEAQVKWALKRYRFMLGDCIRSSWIARAASGKRTSYASWEAIIDTKVDLERAMGILDWRERELVRMRYVQGMSVKDIAHNQHVSEQAVRKWYRQLIRKLAFRLGEQW